MGRGRSASVSAAPVRWTKRALSRCPCLSSLFIPYRMGDAGFTVRSSRNLEPVYQVAKNQHKKAPGREMPSEIEVFIPSQEQECTEHWRRCPPYSINSSAVQPRVGMLRIEQEAPDFVKSIQPYPGRHYYGRRSTSIHLKTITRYGTTIPISSSYLWMLKSRRHIRLILCSRHASRWLDKLLQSQSTEALSDDEAVRM
jgi:hypothetical protein